MRFKVIIIVIEFMYLAINISSALLRAHFNAHLTARAKMSLSRAQNIFFPENINSIVLLNFIASQRWAILFLSLSCKRKFKKKMKR